MSNSGKPNPGKRIFDALNASLDEAPKGMEVAFHFQFRPPSEVYTGEPKVIHHLQLNSEKKKKSDKYNEFAPVRRTYSEDFFGKSSGDEKKTPAKTGDVFPPAEYIRLPDVQRRKQEIFNPDSEYFDLTAPQLCDHKELRLKLKDVMPRISKRGKGKNDQISL